MARCLVSNFVAYQDEFGVFDDEFLYRQIDFDGERALYAEPPVEADAQKDEGSCEAIWDPLRVGL